MRLSALPILNFANINQFAFQNQWHIRASENNTLYFQLVDLDQDSLRYMAGLGTQNQPCGVIVTFPSIDDSKAIMANAVQVNAADSSVWQVSMSASQTPTSGNVIVTVIEGSSSRSFKLMNALQVEYPVNSGSC